MGKIRGWCARLTFAVAGFAITSTSRMPGYAVDPAHELCIIGLAIEIVAVDLTRASGIRRRSDGACFFFVLAL